MKLHDAQGREIPVVCMRDLEISLLDQHGQLITIKEHGAVSPQVSQPILCFGKLLQNGWGVCGAEQALYHQPTNTKIPIDLQNQSMTIQGWIRAIGSLDVDNEAPVSSIRAIKADVFGGMDKGPIGWHLEPDGTGVGRHYSDHFMDPSIARPDVVGNLYRTTLVKHGILCWNFVNPWQALLILVVSSMSWRDFEM